MKIIVFDVSNGFCAIAVCRNGNSLMIDCGSHSEKENPVDLLKGLSASGGWLSEMKPFAPHGAKAYPLTLLSISHPDEDHIRNIEYVREHIAPALLDRRHLEEFPTQALTAGPALEHYKTHFCDTYRGTTALIPDWGFTRRSYRIPMNIVTTHPSFSYGKITNNSSIVTVLEHGSRRVVFGGDLESCGWEWLIENDAAFRTDMSKGIDVFVAPHHGHRSGFPTGLFELSGHPTISILAKGSEYKDGTDVDSRYSQLSDGIEVKSLQTNSLETKKTLTSRSNGNVYVDVDALGEINVYSDR